MASLTALKKQLESAISTDVIVLPKPNVVTEVDVGGFLNRTLKCTGGDISIKSAKVTVSSDKKKVTLTGKWVAFGVTQDITWSFEGGGKGKGITWTFSTTTTDIGNLNSISKYFLQEDAPIPNKINSLINLEVKSITISTSFNTTTHDYNLELSADTDKGGLVVMVEDNSGKLGATVGLKLHAHIKPSDIWSDLDDFDVLQLDEPAVIITNIDHDEHSILNIDGIKKGITLTAGLEMVANKNGSALAKIENELSKGMQNVPMQMFINLNADGASLKAAIEKQFGLPGFNAMKMSDIAFEIDTTITHANPSVKASLSGVLDIPITIPANPDLNHMKVRGAVYFSYATGNGTIGGSLYWGQKLGKDQVLKDPFGFKGLTLKEIGVGIDAHFGAQNGVGFVIMGDYALGNNANPPEAKFAIAIAIDAKTEGIPNPVLLHFKYNNLSLPKIYEACFADPKFKLPSELNSLEFKQLEMYWCEKDTTLPDGSEAKMGIGYNAGVRLFNFDSYSELNINFDNGIKGQCCIDPINIENGKITVTGTGKGNKEFNIDPGGAYFDFDSNSIEFNANLDANVLGMTEKVDAHISTTGIQISIDSKLPFFENNVAVRFMGLTDMFLREKIHVGLDAKPHMKIRNWDIGTFHVNSSLDGSLNVGVKNGKLTAMASGQFTWMNHGFSFNYDVSPYLDKMEDLAEAIGKMIVEKVTEIFNDFFSSATNYLKAWTAGALEGGDFVLNVLYHVYDYTVDNIMDFLATLQHGVHIDGTPDFKIDIHPKIPGASFHADLGRLINQHADVSSHTIVPHGDVGSSWHHIDTPHGDTPHADLHADLSANHTFSTPSFEIDLFKVEASTHFDMKMPPEVHADQHAHVDEHVHLDAAGIVGGELKAKGKIGVDSMVSLDNIKLNARLDVSEEAGANVDIGVSPIHVDANPHITGHDDVAV